MVGQKKKRTISSIFHLWLSVIFVTAFVASLFFSWVYQTEKVRNSAASLLRINIQDARQDIIDSSDQNLLDVTRKIANVLDQREEEASSAYLEQLLNEFDVAEINVIGPDGIIAVSSFPPFANFDMRSGSQSSEFLVLLDGSVTSFVQSYQPMTRDPSLYRKYAGVVLKRGGFVEVGYDAVHFQQDIARHISSVSRNWHVGENGCIIVADVNWNILSDRNKNEGQNLISTGLWIDRETMQPETVNIATIYGEESYFMYTFSEGYYIISVIPRSELVAARNTSVAMSAAMDIVVFVELYILIVILGRILVVNSINRVNGSLSKITGGDLDVLVDVRNTAEFSTLSDEINMTVTTLKEYIAEASARIDQELEFARVIQLSAMPRVFPKRAEFEIHASIAPAKAVGGGFYDVFLVYEDHLALVIADVSGKGIPGAMFMMTTKTLIKNQAKLGKSPEEVLGYVNNQLCDENEGELFVTVWLAVIEISTGKGLAVNAGHEHPAIRRAGGEYELVKYRHAPAVALEEDIRFREHEFELFPGDSLFVYTDGVPEAHNTENKLFGTDRMISALNSDLNASPKKLLETVWAEVDVFQGAAPQFDDITMIGFHYYGPMGKKPEELTVEATMDNLRQVLQLVSVRLESLRCPPQTSKKIRIALEEMYVNIVNYAYAPETGRMTLRVETKEDPLAIIITLIDSGKPFDPLKKPDPDFSIPEEDRPIGGMGIYMVKKSMDLVEYERCGDQNVLRIMKRI